MNSLCAGASRNGVSVKERLLPREDVKQSLTALRSKYFAYLEIKAKKWWIQTDLNRRPGDYESPALTD